MKLIIFLLFFSALLSSCKHPSIDKLVNQAITDKTLPGGVLLVSKESRILLRTSYGSSSFDTLYDIASLTKVVTAISVMILKEEGILHLDDKLSTFYPSLKGDRASITIEDLLRHYSGYPASIDVAESETYLHLINRALNLNLEYRKGEKTVYSDVGFIILGDIVRLVSGRKISDFSKSKIFDPLKMNHSFFIVPDDLKNKCAPTGGPLCLPHDPKALNQYPSPLGHAGVFSTIDDFSKIAQMLLQKGEFGGVRILKEQTVNEMTQIKGDQLRGLGLDLLSPYARAPKGEVFPSGVSYGHTGFTGTTLWIDPKSNSYYVFLSNRVFLGQDITGKPFTELRFNLSTLIGKLIYQ